MTTQNTTDNEPGEALKPCELCGVRLTLQGDYNHEAGWNWWGHPDPEQSNCLLARHKIDTMPDMETPIPADALRWNTRSRAPLAAVAVERADINRILNEFEDAQGGSYHINKKLSLAAFLYEHLAAAASSLPAELPPTHPFGPCGYKYCDWPDGELRCNEPRWPNTAAPLQPEGEQDV